MEEQRGEMWRDLEKLIKMNRALGRENKALREGAVTQVTAFLNVISIGLADLALPPVVALVETKAATTKQADKRKHVELLKRVDNSVSYGVDSWDHCRLCPPDKKTTFFFLTT